MRSLRVLHKRPLTMPKTADRPDPFSQARPGPTSNATSSASPKATLPSSASLVSVTVRPSTSDPSSKNTRTRILCACVWVSRTQ